MYLSIPEIPKAGYPLSESFLRKLIFNKGIPYVKVGRNVRILRADLDAFLDARRVPAQTEAA